MRYTYMFRGYDLKNILIDLAHYDYEEMVLKSMAILNRCFSSYENLLSRAVQAKVILHDMSYM